MSEYSELKGILIQVQADVQDIKAALAANGAPSDGGEPVSGAPGIDDGKGNVLRVLWARWRTHTMNWTEMEGPLVGYDDVKASGVSGREFMGRIKFICTRGSVRFNKVETEGGYGARFDTVTKHKEFERGLRLDAGDEVVVDLYIGPLPDNYSGTHSVKWYASTAEHGTVINTGTKIVAV